MYYVIVSVLLAQKTQLIVLLAKQAYPTNLFYITFLVKEHVLQKHMQR